MDCDDDDFQSQNFQLIGEDNDVFPQSIQPYAPPKFDIDDHFQAHLRLDSLAETGLLLGIQSEENNWIEEFSPRNNVIEFDPSASQTCSISGHDSIWFNAPLSESAQMLVKSVGDDTTVSPQVMNTEADTHAVEDSAKCGPECITDIDSSFLTNKFQRSVLVSNEHIIEAEQHVITPQTPSEEKSEVGFDEILLDKKIDSAGKVVATQCTTSEELTSSSGNVSKACLVAGEPLEVVQNEEPLDNASTRNSSLDDRGCAVNQEIEVSSKFLSCNTHHGPSGLSTNNADIVTGKLDDPLFSEKNVEECYEGDISERSESLQSETKQNETNYNLYGDCKVTDQHFQGHPLNYHVCDVKASSESVSPTDSLMLPNEGSSKTVFFKNSDALLEDIAHQVKVSNKDLSTGDKSSTCTKEAHSSSVEGDGTENVGELCDVAEGRTDFSHCVHEYISKDDSRNPDSQSTEESKMISFEEGNLGTSRTVIDDNCSELRNYSGMAVKVEFSSLMKTETRMTGVDGDNECRVDPSNLNDTDSVQTENSTEGECLKTISEEPTGKSDASENAIHKESCAALSDDAENELCCRNPNKLAPASDTSPSVAELNKDNVVHSAEKENTVLLIDTSGTAFKECSTIIKNAEFCSFDIQRNGTVMESDKNSIMDQAGVSDLTSGGMKLLSPVDSTILQQSHSEVEAMVEQMETTVSSTVASCCNEKGVCLSSLSVIGCNTDTQISRQPIAVPGSDTNDPSVKNFSDGLGITNSDELCVASSAGMSSLVAQQSTEGKDANLTTTNNCDKLRSTETEENNLLRFTLSKSNPEARLVDHDGGNLSSSEPNCGSPTVISCNEHTLEETGLIESNRSSQDPAGPASTKDSSRSKCTVQDSQVSETLKDDGNFTFVVQPDANLSQKDSTKDLTPFSNIQSFKLPQMSEEISQGCPGQSIKESTSTISKMTLEGKRKQVSAFATRKIGISKGDAKEKSEEKQGKGRKKAPCDTSSVPDRSTRSKTHMEDIQHRLFVETNTTKSSCSPSVQASNLPDLNTSVPSALFLQPFTDLQQVQLRAQIFVYGSLIQGVLPDQACMVPAFGGTVDGGRSLWEQVWHSAAQRLYNHKSPNSSGTHLHCHSEQGISCTPFQSKVLNSPASWRDSKVPNSSTQSSNVSLQSAFHSHAGGTHLDSSQSLSPLHPYQTSQIRQYLTNSTPWLSQSSHPASWFFSPQSLPIDSSSYNSPIPVAETVQVTTVRDSSIPHTSNMQLTSSGSLLPNQGANSVSAALIVPSETESREATPAITKNSSVSEKSRKRKKVSASEGPVPKISVSQPQGVSASSPFINLPNSAELSLYSNSSSTVTSAGHVSAASYPITMPYYQILGSSHTQQRGIVIKEACNQIEQSKLQAENASAYAASAVRHSQVIWEQMAIQRKSCLALEVEQKLASAAVAAAAAASVAKAAAEVAKVASEAAVQAKLMADETLNSLNTGTTQISEICLDIRKNLLTSTPVLIPKSQDKIHGSCSIISTAREATRKRAEAASATIKRAENLDAILKCAEMAAEAVSQAGTVITMGDPFPSSICDLVEAGPEGHWKPCCATIKKRIETNDVQVGENLPLDVAGDLEIITVQSTDHHGRQKISVMEEMTPNNKKMILENNYEGCNLENGSQTIPTFRAASEPMQGSNIQKGSLVEVVADEDGLRGAWFSAQVLDVKDGKAYVCYKDLLSDEGHEKLKEWIPLESKSDQRPRIRVAHPVIVTKSEGTRKRQREVAGNCTWAVGDRVDALLRDGWWEGIVTEKSQDDESKLTVHFPAGGDSSIVRSWNLRPSLIWKDGQWIEWSQAKERGDTPYGKHAKLGHFNSTNKSETGEEGMTTLSSNIRTDDSRKLEELRPLNLSAKDLTFSVGSNVGEDNNTDVFKVRRAGLQKDGSKVVFGVPKPGKKRKFMEVSKHYNTDKIEKTIEVSDSIKFAKYLMPQASHSWRNTSKVDVKGRGITNLNRRGPKSLRSQNVQSRSAMDKSVTAVAILNGGESSLGTSFSNEEIKNSVETGSFSHALKKVELAVIEPPLQFVPGVLSLEKKSSAEAEMGEKEKENDLPSVDKLSRSDIKGSEIPGKGSADVVEPRRSNRRIQPTSRLLEGLQSSLIVSKSPLDRGGKSLHRGVSASRAGQNHG
uniref:Agenet domain-containing protein n=1 Tax=Musa acuminata subsp. malaccensis TaxID=214687 RepID=A0A804J401_MUSAM|nr:PREDICTED: uncharacterized protein LOC103984852 isoform X1 [Musa acuminata subsp. malaccensis]XP_018681961.1 PREDICTED: uncharacterized protein LOC103984852 isoform X1 [Musa acuminata subsp. malaccensis]